MLKVPKLLVGLSRHVVGHVGLALPGALASNFNMWSLCRDDDSAVAVQGPASHTVDTSYLSSDFKRFCVYYILVILLLLSMFFFTCRRVPEQVLALSE